MVSGKSPTSDVDGGDQALSEGTSQETSRTVGGMNGKTIREL